jgi:hypothetical protein
MPRRQTHSATAVDQATSKKRKVQAGQKVHKSGQPIHIKPEHAIAYDGKAMFIQEVMTPAPAATALSNTSQFSFIVENDAAGLIKDACLRFQITVTGAEAQLMPVPLWFDRIEWYDRHSGQEIARYHGDAMYLLLQTLNKDALEILEDPVNFDAKTGKESSYKQQVGETKNYYLPLPHVWLQGFQLDLSLLRGDLEIKIYPKGDIKVDGASNAVVSLNEIRWIGCSEMFSQMSRLQFRRSKALATHQQNYIDVQQYTDAGRALSAGTEYTIDLDQFHHESGMLWFCIRPNDNNINALRTVPLGPRGTIDHENVHGRSMLGDGTPIDEEFFRKFINPTCWPQSFCKHNAWYMIPFSNDIPGVFNGEVDGWHEFRGDRERLRLVTGAAPGETSYQVSHTPYVQSAGNTIWYKGASTPTFDYTLITYDQLTALVNALPTVIADGFEVQIYNQVTPAAPLDAPIVFDAPLRVRLYERGTYIRYTATGVTPDWSATPVQDSGQPYNRKGRGLLYFDMTAQQAIQPGGSVNSVIQNVTQGVPGFVGGTYQVEIYSLYYRYVHQHNGRLEMEDL